MAFMSQENKAKLAVEIAKVMPKNWKYSLKVQHHSTLVLTIRQADVDLIGENISAPRHAQGRPTHINLNVYHLQCEYSGKLLKTFEAIKAAMMIGNHDNSEPQMDHFDVGWYIDINIGEWNSPFVVRDILKLSDSYKVSHNKPYSAPVTKMIDSYRPVGMPMGLDVPSEMEWMKNRIAELERRS